MFLKITPNKIKNIFIEEWRIKSRNSLKYQSCSYSQEGEDLILRRFFENKQKGFYVDVGAHHPRRFSNTYIFYKIGWRGINIDAMPGSMRAFNKQRPKDINLEIGVSNTSKKLNYFMFNEPALNTFSKEEALKKDGYKSFKIIQKLEVATKPLKDILKENMNGIDQIDFMSIDVEGFDYQVLTSNDWSLYKPKLILIELQNSTIESFSKSKISQFLNKKGYVYYAKTHNTSFFIYDDKNNN